MSGDTPGCHNRVRHRELGIQQAQAGEAAQHPTVNRTAPQHRLIQAQGQPWWVKNSGLDGGLPGREYPKGAHTGRRELLGAPLALKMD